jgi:YidC/Oxa1 family membrane protein insertase
MFSAFFHTILYQPIFNLFVGLYNILPGHDVGVVIIIITILVRLLVYPLTSKSIKAQKAVQDLQPKIEAIKKEYAKDQQKQAAMLMAVYKDNKVNPFASCLPLLIQLPILIALYMVMRDGLMAATLPDAFYSFVNNPGKLNPISFGFLDLSQTKNYILAILAGAAQYWQAKGMLMRQPPKNAGPGAKDEGMAAMMNKQMLYIMPVMTVLIGVSLPAGLALYWLFSTLLTVAQQELLMRKTENKDAGPSDKNVIEGKVVGK